MITTYGFGDSSWLLGSTIYSLGAIKLRLPFVSLAQPILGIALALTILIQGYVSVRIGIMEARSQRDLGIAGVIAAVLVTKGAVWAFAVGVTLCVLIYEKRFFSDDNGETFVKDVNGDGAFTVNPNANASEQIENLQGSSASVGSR